MGSVYRGNLVSEKFGKVSWGGGGWIAYWKWRKSLIKGRARGMAKMHLPLLVTLTLLNAVNAQFTLLLKVSKASVHLDAILGRPTFSTEAPN